MDRFIDAIEWCAAFFVGLVALNIFLAVVLRKFFSTSIPDSYDIGKMMLGTLIFWGIAATSYRGGHMRHVYGIDRHFDHAFYSYEVGHAKPSPAFFGHIVAELGLPAEQVAFVDDAPANVRGARLAGLRAALHRVGDGASGLAADLAGLGVPI